MQTLLLPLLLLADARWEAAEPCGWGERRLSATTTEGRYEGTLPFGAGGLRVAVQAEFVWIDSNQDGNLEDERPRAAAKEGGGWRHDARIALVLPGAIEEQATVYDMAWVGDRFRWRHNLHLRGGIVVADRLRPYSLEDGNGDLRFDDPETDFLRIDLDGDGHWSDAEAFALGVAPCTVGVKGLEVAIAFAEGAVLGGPGAEARARALEDARRPGPHDAAAKAAMTVLGACADPVAVTAALETAVHYGGEVQEECARVLSFARGRETVRALSAALGGKQAAQAALALRILGAIPTEDSTEVLAARLKRERDPELQRALLDAAIDRKDPVIYAGWLGVARERANGDVTRTVADLRRFGFAHAAVRGALSLLLRSRLWEERIYALDAMGAVPIEQVAVDVADSLDHTVWQVRMAAAEALGRIRVHAAVEPLIRAMGKEKMPRVLRAMGASLDLLTGEGLGPHVDLWRKWWDRFGAGFVPTVAPAPPRKLAEGERRSVATFYGVPVLSEKIIFVIDQSASMLRRDEGEKGNRFAVAVEEVLTAAGKLDGDAKINVIFFGTEVWRWEKSLQKVSAATLTRLGRDLKARRPIGATYLFDAVEIALEDEEVETIYLLSDGSPSGGKFVEPADIMREVMRRNQLRRATLHCISIGEESSLLRSLAAANGGQYVQR